VYPWLRLTRVVIGLIGQPPLDPFTTTRVRVRVWPNDLDFNFHVNNGRYLTLADLGRIHWFARTGILRAARRHQAHPVVGDAIARFRRDLRAFQSFEIHTRLIGWDEKWGFLEHRFVRGGRVIGVVAVRGLFKGPSGPLAPGMLFGGASPARASLPLPGWAQRFDQSSELLSEMLREEERTQGLR
jgi:acyl-CoA thioesterase FadM